MRGKLIIPGVLFLFTAFAFRVLLPNFPGFYIIGGVIGLILSAFALTGRSKPSIGGAPPGRGEPLRSHLVPWARLLGALVIVILAGSVSFLPVINVAAPKEAALDDNTLELIAKLPGKVSFEAKLTLSSPGPTLFLLNLYAEASPLIEVSSQSAKGHTSVSPDGEVRVAEQDTLLISSEGFSETVFPINKTSINASLRRLISPHRLVYNLIGEGERSSLDPGPRGLKLWAEELKSRRIYLDDYPFRDGERLPLDVRALVLSGPRMPLSEEKELALLDFLERGGKLFLMADPLVAGISDDFLSKLSLRIPEGLVIDPELVWAGTEETFVVSSDFPAHPMTVNLRDPVLWPLAGAIMTVSETAKDTPKAKVRELTLIGDEDQSPSQNSEGEEESQGNQGSLGDQGGLSVQGSLGVQGNLGVQGSLGGSDKTMVSSESAVLSSASSPTGIGDKPVLRGRTNAVALTSSSAWLETDKKSIASKDIRYQSGEDPPGPLVLASATTLLNGGKLVLVADSDLASNAYINFAGNLDLLNQALYFLLDSEAALASPREGTVLEVTESVARQFFWIPVVLWPLLVLLIWTGFYFHRRRLSS